MRKFYFFIFIFCTIFFVQLNTTNDNFQPIQTITEENIVQPTQIIQNEIIEKDIIVYITNTGTRYHRESCPSLYASKIETTLEKAQKRGLTPCKRCVPVNE